MGNKQQDAKKIKKKENIFDSTEGFFRHSLQGQKRKHNLPNQDASDIINGPLGEDVRYFGVYDGHGVKGEEAANYVKREMRKYLLKNESKISKFEDKEEVHVFFKNCMSFIQKELSKAENEFELSGTCVCSILVVKNKVFSVNLGDSRVVLGSLIDNKKIATELSVDHKATRDNEAKRIKDSGGNVSDKSGVARIYKKYDTQPGLAVTRSIGDLVAHECGVISLPEVFQKEIAREDKFMIVCSDGVWDVFSSREAVGFVFECIEKRIDNPATSLVEECRARWEMLNIFKYKCIFETNDDFEDKESGEEMQKQHSKFDIDDITCIIYRLN